MDNKEGWAPKNWWFWTVVLEKALETPLDCKEIKPVNPKENQSWIFTGRTDAEAEAPILSVHYVKNRLIGKKPWCWERLRAGGERGDKEWDGWIASLIQWAWVWASSKRQWRTGKPGFPAVHTIGSQNWIWVSNWTTIMNRFILYGLDIQSGFFDPSCNCMSNWNR